MSGSLNKVLLIGNLGADPEVRAMQSGDRCATFSLATSESWKDKNTDDRKQRTEWHRVVIFDQNLVKIAEQYLHKGSKVYLEGQLQTRKWTDQKGEERYTTEVVLQRFRSTLTMLDSKRNGPPAVENADEYGTVATQDAPAHNSAPETPDLDDDIPF